MVLRRRYYFWLLRAYLKRWKKTVLLSILLGVGVFFASAIVFNLYIQPIFEKKVEKVGFAGTFLPSTLPESIVLQISHGLTHVDEGDSVGLLAASKWEIQEKGKKYIFTIKPKQYFHNNRELTTDNFPLEFEDVARREIDKYTVEYTLKAPYAPFLSTVSKPIFINGLVGLGEYKVRDVELNAGFVKSISMQHHSDSRKRKTYLFYPTEDALKMAFMLGEVDRAEGLSSTKTQKNDLVQWQNVEVTKAIDYSELVTVFYNNTDNNLSDKKIRQALSYALSDKYLYGERAFSPIPKNSIYYSVPATNAIVDRELAKTLLESANIKDGDLTLEIATTREYEEVAFKVREEWATIGVKSTITIVDSIPSNYQVFIYSFKVPKDPDQYTLWHSGQKNNITHYKNLRIDKLLEDGRIITNEEERKKIYQDFQKYLLDDSPASFLYFPYTYSVKRI
jgi:peptide/nickel transport system substrate-binding protein